MRTPNIIANERLQVLCNLGELTRSYEQLKAAPLARVAELDAELEAAQKAATPEAVTAKVVEAAAHELRERIADVEVAHEDRMKGIEVFVMEMVKKLGVMPAKGDAVKP